MDELTPIKTDSPAEESQLDFQEVLEGKSLSISRDTPHINYKGLLGQVVQYVKVGDILGAIKAGSQYVVQIPANLQADFDAGNLFMMQNQKTGVMRPTLMKMAENGKQQIVTNLPIKEELLLKGNPVQELSSSFHSLLMQQQLSQVSDRVEETYHNVKKILAGQMDDRIGRLEAGKNLLLTALKMPYCDERTMQLSNSRNEIMVAQAQLGETLKRRVSLFSPVPQNSWVRLLYELRPGGYIGGKNQEVNEMQELYALYLEATNLAAWSYTLTGQTDAAEETYRISERFMSTINFDHVQTISYAHPNSHNMFYSHPITYLKMEKIDCLEAAKNYDYVTIEVSGEELLEAISDGQISETRTEQ